jgi:hypothetical protein
MTYLTGSIMAAARFTGSAMAGTGGARGGSRHQICSQGSKLTREELVIESAREQLIGEELATGSARRSWRGHQGKRGRRECR